MIALESTAAFAGLAARLIVRARKMAEARAQEAVLARREPAARWRKARLVWPLFTGD